jgi:4-hydroxybenzoyl-CoA thioesterase
VDRERAPSGQLEATAAAYRSEVLVRFAHCDPAGIVFYPRYLEMFNNLVEDWCNDALGISFRELHAGRGWGLPTVHLDVDFVAPCTMGEVLQASLVVRAIGNSSIRLEIVFQGPDGRDRVRGKVVLVLTDVRCSRGVPLPEDLRGRLAKFLIAEE